MLKHKDLLFEFHEEQLPEKDFEFIGSDGKIYIFNVSEFEYQLREYRRSDVTDQISTINGSIEEMVRNRIAKLKP